MALWFILKRQVAYTKWRSKTIPYFYLNACFVHFQVKPMVQGRDRKLELGFKLAYELKQKTKIQINEND
jgi:hypothetical protein